jgi:hypothetical protein
MLVASNTTKTCEKENTKYVYLTQHSNSHLHVLQCAELHPAQTNSLASCHAARVAWKEKHCISMLTMSARRSSSSTTILTQRCKKENIISDKLSQPTLCTSGSKLVHPLDKMSAIVPISFIVAAADRKIGTAMRAPVASPMRRLMFKTGFADGITLLATAISCMAASATL